MASKTDIANRALSKVGESRVSNIETDTTAKAQTINSMFDSIRDALLTSYPWNFTITRTQLAASGTTPSWEFQNDYPLPTDFLALLEIQNSPVYRLEGKSIVTDAGSPIFIRYIRQVTNTGDFDALFVEAFATRLAFESVEKITQSNTKKRILGQEFQANIAEAYASDSIQETPQKLPVDDWLLSRQNRLPDDIDFSLAEITS